MANETTRTSAVEFMHPEVVNQAVIGLERPLPIGRLVAWEEAGKLATPFNYVAFEDFDVPSGTKTEGTGDYTRVAITLAEQSCTPALVGMEWAPTDEFESGQYGGLTAQYVSEILAEMDKRRDEDILASSTSATNTVGTVSDIMTTDKLFAAMETWSALDNPAPNGVVCIMHSKAATQLLSDRAQSGATMVSRETFGGRPVTDAYKGNIAGVDVWQSNNISAESTGRSNIITAAGRQYSGLGYVQARDIMVEFNRSAEGARGGKSFYVFSMGYGTCLTKTSKLVELLTN